MTLRTKSRCFSNNQRAIVLPDDENDGYEPVEEPMPMFGSTRVDRHIKDLLNSLEQVEGLELSEHNNNQIKATFNNKITYLPTKYIGGSQMHEIRRSLNGIGVVTRSVNGQLSINVDSVPTDEPVHDEREIPFLGVMASEDTIAIFTGLLAALKKDIDAKIKEEVDIAIDSLTEDSKWREIAEKYEQELVNVRKERDQAVRDLVSQRDEARKERDIAQEELSGIRRSLAGLQGLLQPK